MRPLSMANYGMIGNRHTGALVETNGAGSGAAISTLIRPWYGGRRSVG
jgi:hypothetical protein